MALTVKHATLTGAAANSAALVDGPKWDADHTITGNLSVSQLNGGTNAGATTFWCGNETWAAPTTLNGATIDNLAWSTYTPVVTSQTNTITAYTATGRYKQIGKTVICETDVVITTVGTASGIMLVTVPVTAAAFRYAGISLDYGATLKSGAGYINGGSTPTLFATQDSTGNTFFAANAKVVSSFTYEVP